MYSSLFRQKLFPAVIDSRPLAAEGDSLMSHFGLCHSHHYLCNENTRQCPVCAMLNALVIS
jgi:hypothetical protein